MLEENRSLAARQAAHELQIKQLRLELEKEQDKLANAYTELQGTLLYFGKEFVIFYCFIIFGSCLESDELLAKIITPFSFWFWGFYNFRGTKVEQIFSGGAQDAKNEGIQSEWDWTSVVLAPNVYYESVVLVIILPTAFVY